MSTFFTVGSKCDEITLNTKCGLTGILGRTWFMTLGTVHPLVRREHVCFVTVSPDSLIRDVEGLED